MNQLGQYETPRMPMPSTHVAPMPKTSCAFPAPPVRNVYCFPAPYSQINGQKYQTLALAYGQPRQINAM